MIAGARILLIIGGGIAAYKTLELIRMIARAGGEVRVLPFLPGHSTSRIIGDMKRVASSE